MQFAIFIMLSVLLLARGFISPKSTPCRINTLGGREITAFTSSQRFNNSPLFTRRKLLPNSTASRYLSSKRHISSKNNESEVYTKLGNCKSIAETLRAGVQRLEEYSAPEPTASACHLLSFALKDDFRWEDNGFSTLLNILDNPRYDKNLSEKEIKRDELDCFSKMLERRIAKEPLQYIIGQWDFHDCVLKIRPPCLCPRPETEELVEYAANDIKRMIQLLRANGSDRKLRILDVGCGTGAIGIAVANLFKNDVEVVAIDVAKAAIGLSEENARFVLGDKQSCYHKPILCPATEYTGENKVFVNHTFQYDIVISNPPYIPSKDMDTLTSDVVDYEDYGALCGGDDGLDVVRDILKRLPEWCDVRKDPHLFNPICWMEVDTSHPILIEKSAGQHESIEFLQGLKDFGGLDRFVQLEIKLKNN
mmetsp:Transcript_14150/g.21231  ORF Transcript_14150/g.21231 Transcript_14150/m.21231 type:complete len:421 (-) Transcript_14150:10-1272(-)